MSSHNKSKAVSRKFKTLSRRQFIKISAAGAASAGIASLLSGCGIDPVTGRNQLMLVSRQQEIGIDQQQAPFQFSADYGVTQDSSINRYVSSVGRKLVPHVHRLDMPYNFQCVNATYINAYAFPGGTIAATRGILLELDDEAQLASLLGHELGHVNARHAAEQMSKGQISSILVGGLSMIASQGGGTLGELTQTLGMIGQGLLLSKYSRDNEREADYLGNEYMVKAGYPSKGFTGLMEMLSSLHKSSPSSVEVLFSTHPMSSERLSAAIQRQNGQYFNTRDRKLFRERYMDSIASLRRREKGIKLLQEGEKHMGKKAYDQAENSYRRALSSGMDDDYTAHILLAQSLLARKQAAKALTHAGKAQQLYPSEAQGYYTAGIANTGMKRYNAALMQFQQCDRVLPGNPHLKFLSGYCLDKSNQIPRAADYYKAYLKMINYSPNDYSKYAYQRLKQWGYAK